MLKNILQTLVSIPTVTSNRAAADQGIQFIKQFLEERGMATATFESGGFTSLLAGTRSLKKPKVLLAAHLDVVPGTPELFTIREEEGKLYGRGVLDMKFAIACFLQVVDDLQDNLAAYDFGIMITTDEEFGGQNGVDMLIEQEGCLPEVCILPDGGDNWQIQLHSKGILYLTLSRTGKPAHGSRPWLGENAILVIVDALKEIQQLFPESKADSSTLNVGLIKGGNAPNQVADYAEATLDIRLMNESERIRLLDAIRAICERHGVEVTIELNGAVGNFELTNPYIKPFAELITEVTGVEVIGSHTLGSNDTRFFAAYNVPCISFYPPGGGHHGAEEWMETASLEQCRTILQRYLKAIALIN